MRHRVFVNGRPVGVIVKYVGETARTMGGDPVWVASSFNDLVGAAAFTSHSHAREWLTRATMIA